MYMVISDHIQTFSQTGILMSDRKRRTVTTCLTGSSSDRGTSGPGIGPGTTRRSPGGTRNASSVGLNALHSVTNVAVTVTTRWGSGPCATAINLVVLLRLIWDRVYAPIWIIQTLELTRELLHRRARLGRFLSIM